MTWLNWGWVISQMGTSALSWHPINNKDAGVSGFHDGGSSRPKLVVVELD